jgi:hypothetical protein
MPGSTSDSLMSSGQRSARCTRWRGDEPEEVGNLYRSAQAGRRQPRIHVSGNIHLVGLPQQLVATNAKGHALSLLAQVNCFLIKTLFET